MLSQVLTHRTVLRLLFLAALFIGSRALAIPFEGHQMVMAGPNAYAIHAGEKIGKAGGNVVDVAITMELTLAVTHAYNASLGGGGFALVKMGNEQPVALDFRETAPAQTEPNFYTGRAAKASQDGGTAVGIPGVAAGLVALHKKYGRLPWRKLFEEPIAFAEKGFAVSGEWVDVTMDEKPRFTSGGLLFFFKEGGAGYKPGETIKQPQLAKALKALRDRGADGFYSGDVARDIVESSKKTGGVLAMEDLKNYKVRWLPALKTSFRGHEVYLMPPPSSGGVVISTALSLTDRLHPEQYGVLSVDELHSLGEILKRSFRGRSLLGDPDFHPNPIGELLSDKYLKDLAESFSVNKSKTVDPIGDKEIARYKESSETTHFSIMDAEGNSVALTVTANGHYGSGVITEKYGITLNNEMDDFTTKPGEANQFGLVQGTGNKVQAGKRPLSSMSPTIVLRDGKTVLALGAPGGPRIISAVYQALYRVTVSGMNMDRAIQSPRVHHQFMPAKLYIDGDRFVPETVEGLKKKGHEITTGPIAKVYGVRRNEKGWLESAFDSRGEGSAGGF